MEKKIKNVIKEIVRNEAVSTDKLQRLAKEHKLNQKRITYIMRQAGVLEIMGQGVYKVLIRDKDMAEYIVKATEVMEADIGKRRKKKPTVDKPKADKPYDIFADALKDNPDGHVLMPGDGARSVPPAEIHYSYKDDLKEVKDMIEQHAEIIIGMQGDVDELTRRLDESVDKELNDINEQIVHHSDQLGDLDMDVAAMRNQLKELALQVNKLAAFQKDYGNVTQEHESKIAITQLKVDGIARQIDEVVQSDGKCITININR